MPDDRQRPVFEAQVQDLIARYEQIAQASHEMVAAARAGDWDAVARLEDLCRSLIAAIRSQPTRVELPGPQQRRRIALLRSILADDAEIRDRSEPWLRQLEQLLGARTRTVRHDPGD